MIDNYFILLELSFDPLENNEEKILAAISKKQKEWCSEGNPVRIAMYREYLSHLGEIKKVMLDPTLRKQESEKAKNIKAEKFISLRNRMMLFHAKAEMLSERDMEHLMKQYGKYGITAEEIRTEFKNTF